MGHTTKASARKHNKTPTDKEPLTLFVTHRSAVSFAVKVGSDRCTQHMSPNPPSDQTERERIVITNLPKGEEASPSAGWRAVAAAMHVDPEGADE